MLPNLKLFELTLKSSGYRVGEKWGGKVIGGLDWLKHNILTGKIPRQSSSEQWKDTLNNEEQECRTGHTKGRVLVRRGGQMKAVKEGEYDWCTFYTSMNMEHWNLLKSF
jgi:hypothetical protein